MNTEGRSEKGENKNKMDWWMEENGEPVKIPEEVLKYKTEHREIQPDTLVVNEEIKEWTPLKDTQFYKALQAEKTPEENTWACPRCGTRVTSEFCPNCGRKKRRPPAEPWICPSCKTPQTGRRCEQCGLLCPTEEPDERCRGLAILGHILGVLALLINPAVLIPLARISSLVYGFVAGMGVENLRSSPLGCGTFAIIFGIIVLIVNRNYPGSKDKKTARWHAGTGLVGGIVGVILALTSAATM